MRGKAKRFLLSGLVVLLIVPLLGCGFLERLVNPPSLDSRQAIALVQFAAVPYIDDYFKETIGEEEAAEYSKIGPATPLAGWSASYQGDGEWRVQGPVTTKSWGECMTIWTLSEAESKIKLIGFNCD